MTGWTKIEAETKDRPDDGEIVQFAVIHFLTLKRLGIPIDDVMFFMREIE